MNLSVDSTGQNHRSRAHGCSIGASIRRFFTRKHPPEYSRGAWSIICDVPFPAAPPYTPKSRPPTYQEALEIGVVASPLRIEQRMRSRNRSYCCYRHPASLHAIDCAAHGGMTTVAPSLPPMSSLPSLDEESEHQHGGDAGQSSINFSGAPSTSGSAPGSANMPDERSVRHNDCTGDETANISADGGIFPEVPDNEGVLPTYMDVEDSSPMSAVVRQWRLGEHAIEKPSIHPLGYRYPASSVTSS